jgi:hypothetical protein
MPLFNETVKPVGQPKVSRNVIRLTIALCVFIVLWADSLIGQPGGLDDIYTTRAVVTGTDERNRPLGFRLCFEDVLVKVSGDARFPRFPTAIDLRGSQFTTNRAPTAGLIF